MPHFIFSRFSSIMSSVRDWKKYTKISLCSFRFDDYHPDAARHVAKNFNMVDPSWDEDEMMQLIDKLQEDDKSDSKYVIATNPNMIFRGDERQLSELCEKFTRSIWKISKYDQGAVQSVLHRLLWLEHEKKVSSSFLWFYVRTYETRWSPGDPTLIPPNENTQEVRDTLWIAANHPKRTMDLQFLFEQERTVFEVHNS